MSTQTPQDSRPQETEDLVEAMTELAEGKEVLATPRVPEIEGVQAEAADASPSVMYPAILLPAAPLVSSSPSSVSPTANVGLSLECGRPTDTPPLSPAKSRTSLLAKLSTSPTAHSPLSEMDAKASRVRSIPGQI
ncbi:hypothetical protein LWI28_016552 [Acer negundo]|uniref:Uncharacterized protein n=1 Tax=Acer negundo TaxID=4023 RepID=A0AAD5I6G9_ACENE|nr:hypothetical protein LWI28_016552 [Acer negundo]